MQFHAGRPGNDPVGHSRRNFTEQETILAIFAPAVDHVIPCVKFFQQPGNIGRIVLAIRIHRHDDLAASVVKTGRKGGRLPKIAAKADCPDLRKRLLQSFHFPVAAVAAAIVNEHNLIVVIPEGEIDLFHQGA